MRPTLRSRLTVLLCAGALATLAACGSEAPPPPPQPMAFPADKEADCTAQFAGGMDLAPDTIETDGTVAGPRGDSVLRMQTRDGSRQARCELDESGNVIILPQW